MDSFGKEGQVIIFFNENRPFSIHASDVVEVACFLLYFSMRIEISSPCFRLDSIIPEIRTQGWIFFLKFSVFFNMAINHCNSY